MKTQYLFAGGLLVSLLVLGCDQPAPVASDVSIAQFDFMNGPSDLPNVFRGDSLLLFWWADFARDLVIAINAPTGGVGDSRRCGGPDSPALQPVQSVGELQGVLRQLRLWRDVNIHLYRPVPPSLASFLDLCELSPYAQGTGNFTTTTNDRFVTGSGANARGFRAEGIVELASGGSARVTAEAEALIMPDGETIEWLVSNVMLHPR